MDELISRQLRTHTNRYQCISIETSSPEQIVAVVAAVSTDPFTLAVKIAAGGLSTNTDIVLPGSLHVVVVPVTN